MPVEVCCVICSKTEQVTPTRASFYRTCSHACASEWRTRTRSGAGHHRWQGGERTKACDECGQMFEKPPLRAVSVFRRQRFCSKQCADKGGLRYSGPDNWKWKGGHSNRSNKQRKWATAVISRDGAKCVRCGAEGVELHAHHIKPFKDHPDLRWDISNGETLCCHCHWDEHAAPDANGVNSGKLLPGDAGDNPEPSPSRKVREGVTTRGRAYRRWEGHCGWCGTFLSKRLSDVKGRSGVFCSRSCATKHTAANRKYRPTKNPQKPMVVISSTSAPRESGDIVWPRQ